MRRFVRFLAILAKSVHPSFLCGFIIASLLTNISNAAPTYVHTTATLSVPRYDLAATTVGTDAIFAGGTGQGGPSASSAVDIYNEATGTWTTASLSTPRCKLAATTVGTDAIFAGGCLNYNEDTYSSRVDIYNEATNTWSASSLSVARGYLGAVTVGNNAYFAGGATSEQGGYPTGISNLINVYNATSGTWSTLTMPHARYDFTPVAVGSQIIFFGGGAQPVDTYNTNTGTWTTTTLNDSQEVATRGGYAAATVGPDAIFYGGIYGGQYLNNIDIYNSITGEWSTQTTPINTGYAAAAVFGNDAIFAGGAYTTYLTQAQNFDSGTGTFTSVDPLSDGRLALAATTVGNQLIFAGGYGNGGQQVNAVDIYTVPVPEPTAGFVVIATGAVTLSRRVNRSRRN